jgi:hypothetical protein
MRPKIVFLFAIIIAALLLCNTHILLAQSPIQPVVTGKVTSEAGENLVGVNVKVETMDGKVVTSALTNDGGIFKFNELKANTKYNFTFSYLGYAVSNLKSFMVRDGSGNSILIRMKESINKLKYDLSGKLESIETILGMVQKIETKVNNGHH